jgi:hypothetical protein
VGAAVAALATLLAGAPANAEARISLSLPRQTDLPAVIGSIERIVNAGRAIETKLPGRVTDREEVAVGLGPDGTPATVAVSQVLKLHGLGDFVFKVPGPARDVSALPESVNQPGLRAGAVLWQGFSPGEKTLAAQVELDPRLEQDRLPLRFAIDGTIGGRPWTPSRAASGPLDLRLTITNASAIPVIVAGAEADPAAVAPPLDAVRAAIRAGDRPVPGAGDVPARVAAFGPPQTREEQIEAPFAVSGSLRFPAGSLTGVTVDGGEASEDANGIRVGFRSHLGGGSPMSTTIRVRGTAHDLRLPGLDVSAEPALPLPSSLEPPEGSSWAAYGAAHPDRATGETMLRALMEATARVARLRQYDTYLGNPDATGPAAATYRFAFAPPDRPAAPVVAAAPFRPAVAVAGVLIGVLLLALALEWWARA